MTKPVVYLIGSLRNPEVPLIGDALRSAGFEVFDDWFAAGPIADDSWQEYEKGRGIHYKDALSGYAARHVFEFDLRHLNRASIAVLVLPAGKSGHLEFGYCIGQGKPGYVLFQEEPERWDVMYQFANDVFFSKEEMVNELKLKHLSEGVL
jgi:nucleoside 2-deoxyribosyltransferase